MPICKKCQNTFPNRIVLNGKEKYLNKRSYCLICSPLGKNSGIDLRKQNTNEKYYNLTGDSNILSCLICERQFSRKKKNNLVCSTCRANYLRYKNRKKGIELLGGKCNKCNETDTEVLQFHHIDPTQKDFGLSSNWNIKNWEILKKEIEKCKLLCANCHIKEHKKDIRKIIEYFDNELSN